jgi:hypothetical protein
MLGILVLDNPPPRVRGDVGCADAVAFPVRYAKVEGATVDEVARHHDRMLLPLFIAAGKKLVDDGGVALVTTCAFLARWQSELTSELPVPVLSSALLQVPLVMRTLPAGREVGTVTYSAASLTPEVLTAAGVSPSAPIEAVSPGSHFADAMRNGALDLDPTRMADDVAAAARRLVGARPRIGALVLECASMPSYTPAVKAATEMPVFDAAQLIRWFYEGVTGIPVRHAPRDLW